MKAHFSIIQKFAIFFVVLFLGLNYSTQAQNNKKATLSVLNVDTQGFNFSPQQMGNLVRIEMQKLNLYEVIDRYDVAYLIKKHNLIIDNCYGKICLVETGKIINSDKMFSGSVEKYGKTIIITFRLVDVKSATIERTHVREFLDLPGEIQEMIRITIQEMYDMPVEQEIITQLTEKYNYENAVNNPNKMRLSLGGPRMGVTGFTGETASYIKMSEEDGGYDALPLMFLFGYQFELQYLTHGDFQALFEIIPNVTGLDQGLFLPSLSLMQGLRHKSGFEFAFGPILSFSKKATGYYDNNNQWHLPNKYDSIAYPQISRFDSRGELEFNPGFIFGIGKTFKSGNLNIPVNLFVVPRKKGLQVGLSFGYNTKKNE